MIDEKELIAKLEHMVKESKEESGLKEPALLQKIIEEVKDMAVNEEIKARIEREDASSAWIPVSERLPKNDRFVLVTVRGVSRPHIDVDNYEPNYETWNTYDADGEVIAWMPLPCPFCGGEARSYEMARRTGGPSYVRCGNCGTETTGYPSKEKAIAAWNRRA